MNDIHTFVTQACATLLLTQLDCVGLDECIISEIKSREAVLETLSLWITARMWWATEPLHVLCPLLLIFIFADSLFPKPLYRPFSWTYLCSMPEEGLSPSITGMQPSATQVLRCHKGTLLHFGSLFSETMREKLSMWDKARQWHSITWLVWVTNSSSLRNTAKLTNIKKRWKHSMSLLQFHARLLCIIAVFPCNKEPLLSE